MDIAKPLKAFSDDNLQSLHHPTKNKFLSLSNTHVLVDLLLKLLNYRIEEPSLSRVKENFEINFLKIYNLELKELPYAIENLSTNFESFLKKLAYLKFTGTTLWEGNETHVSILQCTLADLLRNQAPPKRTAPAGTEPALFPDELVNTKDTNGAILDHVRDKLRNAVHYAKSYNRSDLIRYSNYSLGIYLMAIQDNLLFLKKLLFPEYGYLEAILSNNEIKKLNSNYVELYSIENVLHADNLAVEVLDGAGLLATIEQMSVDETEEKDETQLGSARVDSVYNIAKDVDHFLLIGEPGSGKTTTLLNIQYRNCVDLLNGNPNAKLPVYINASNYSADTTIKALVEEKLNLGEFRRIQNRFPVLLLIDGLNEINDSLKRKAFDEIKSINERYPKVSFILSTRKFSFYNHWHIPVYELKELNENQIEQLITNILGIKGKILHESLINSPQIFMLCHNPLMLMMVVAVHQINNESLPKNRGALYKVFNEAILAREKKIYATDVATKLKILSTLAYEMRREGVFRSLKLEQVRHRLQNTLERLDRRIGVNEIINELLDSNILTLRDGLVEFIHETYQEFYVALEIKDEFFTTGNLSFDYGDTKWLEPLLICSDLIIDEEEKNKFIQCLFVGRRTGKAKPLSSFSVSDVNLNFIVACKIAHANRQETSSIYYKIETLLNNYLVLSSFSKSYGKELVPFKLILAGVAALSSETLFLKIFSQYKYLTKGFYYPAYDQDSDNFDLLEVETNLAQLTTAFSSNLSNFLLFYKTICSIIDGGQVYWISRSIRVNIRRFKNYVLKNTSVPSLIAAFKVLNTRELLCQIGLSELDFYLQHYRHVGLSNQKAFRFIIKNHLNSVYGQTLLFQFVREGDIDEGDKIEICEALLTKSECYSEALQALAQIYSKDKSAQTLDQIRKVLNALPLKDLKENDLSAIFHTPTVTEWTCTAKIIDKESGTVTVKIDNRDIPNSIVRKHSINFFVEDQRLVPIVNTKHGEAQETVRVIVVEGNIDDVDEALVQHSHEGNFSIIKGEFSKATTLMNFKYQYLIRGVNRTRFHLMVQESVLTTIASIFKASSTVKLVLGNKLVFNLINFNTFTLSHSILKLSKNVELQTHLPVRLYEVEIDLTNPYLYHPDVLLSKEVYTNFLRQQYSETELGQSFAKKLGIKGAISPGDSNLKYWLITYTHRKLNGQLQCYIQELSSGKKNLVNLHDPEDTLKCHDVIVIENIHRYNKVDIKSLPSDLFIESAIVTIDHRRKSGFIKNATASKDFYFSVNALNFEPTPGMKVKFIPGINTARKFIDMPVAHCIQPVDEKLKVAKLFRAVAQKDYINLFLKNEPDGLDLFSRIRESEFKSIRGFDGKLSPGKCFYYRLLPVQHQSKLARVILIEQSSKY